MGHTSDSQNATLAHFNGFCLAWQAACQPAHLPGSGRGLVELWHVVHDALGGLLHFSVMPAFNFTHCENVLCLGQTLASPRSRSSEFYALHDIFAAAAALHSFFSTLLFVANFGESESARKRPKKEEEMQHEIQQQSSTQVQILCAHFTPAVSRGTHTHTSLECSV